MAKSKNSKEDITFQDALAELQDINQWLSEEPMDYDLMIAKVRRAKYLLDYCSEKLTEGETIINSIFE